MSDGALSPRGGASRPLSPDPKGDKNKPKKKMKETIKGVFKTERKKKDKSKKKATAHVKVLIDFLSQNSLDQEGLMRVSGNQNEVKKLKALLDSGEPVNLSSYLDHNVITGVFKLIFREMPEPLLTFDLYRNFLAANDLKDTNARTSFLKSFITTLPPFNAELFNSLLFFLYRIQSRSSVNKMTSENLAIVFAPTILRPREETVDTMMGDAAACTSVVKFMIDNCKALFPDTQNLPIISTIVSEESKGKIAPASLESSLDQLNDAMQNSAKMAREKAVWETYAQKMETKLEEVNEEVKIVKEERDGLLEVVKDIRQSKGSLEEQLTKLQEQVDTIPKLQAEITTIKAERDTAVEDKFKQLSALGASNTDSQKQITALQAELGKMRTHHDSEKKTLEEKVSKLQKEKTDNDTKNNATIKSKTTEIQQLEQKLSAQFPEIEKLKEQVKAATAKEQELSKQVESLRAQSTKTVKDLDAKSQEATKLKKEKQEVEEKLNKLTKSQQDDKKKLETESASKDSKLAESQKQAADFQKQATDSQKQVADLQKQSSDYQKQLADLQAQVDTLTTENTRLAKKSETVVVAQAAPAAASNAAKPNDAELKQLEKDKKALQDEKQAFQAEKKSLETEKKAIQDERKTLQDEKKAHQETKKLLDAKTEEVEKLKKAAAAKPADEAESANKKRTGANTTPSVIMGSRGAKPAAAPTSPSTATSSASGFPAPPGGISVEEDLKQHLFTWLTLALKFDRMAMRRICNINASILYEQIIDQKVHYADWPSFIRAEMDKCTEDM